MSTTFKLCAIAHESAGALPKPAGLIDLIQRHVLTRIVTCDVTVHDGAFHPATDDPDWAESSCFTLSVPERDINGFIYYFHDVRCGISGGGPALWDPTGEQPHDCLFYDWRWRQPPTGPIEFDDFTLPNSLRHQVAEQSRRYRLCYSQLGLDFELDWAALMPPHQLGPADDSAGHFDQPGKMTGTLTLDGEHFDIDCYSIRDPDMGTASARCPKVRRRERVRQFRPQSSCNGAATSHPDPVGGNPPTGEQHHDNDV